MSKRHKKWKLCLVITNEGRKTRRDFVQFEHKNVAKSSAVKKRETGILAKKPVLWRHEKEAGIMRPVVGSKIKVRENGRKWTILEAFKSLRTPCAAKSRPNRGKTGPPGPKPFDARPPGLVK
ncbi:MAG: hypothetical protein AB7V55_03005 [Oscillospiraceae bacterium]